MVYKIIITPVCSWSLLTLRSSNEIKYNTIVDIIIKDKKCIVTLVIMHLIYSISIASLFCTHLNVMCQKSIMYSCIFLEFCNRFSCNKCNFELFGGRNCQAFRWMLLPFTMRRMTGFIPTF
jgi:hypothetical protein